MIEQEPFCGVRTHFYHNASSYDMFRDRRVAEVNERKSIPSQKKPENPSEQLQLNWYGSGSTQTAFSPQGLGSQSSGSADQEPLRHQRHPPPLVVKSEMNFCKPSKSTSYEAWKPLNSTLMSVWK